MLWAGALVGPTGSGTGLATHPGASAQDQR
jgi:hypothetical protein